MNYTSCTTKSITKDDLEKVLELIKPKFMVVTSDEKAYEKLLGEKPFGYDIRFDKVVNGTFVIDLKNMEKAMKPPFISY